MARIVRIIQKMDKPNMALEKRLNILAIIISVIVLLVVGMMRRVKLETGIDFSFLPPINAALNSIAALVLIFVFYKIKKGQREAHRKAILAAVGISFLFFLSYVLYHFTTPETTYGGEGIMRGIYFFFLITHVVLAAVIFPFILFTLIRAITGHFERHRKMARWVWPLWLYVAISGPICYLMLTPYY